MATLQTDSYFQFKNFAIFLALFLYSLVYFADDLRLIMQVTKPKLIFCDGENISKVQEALKKLNSTIPIFTFDRNVEGVRLVDELFIDNGTNINHFV